MMNGMEKAWRVKHMKASVRTAQGKPTKPKSLDNIIGKTTPLKLDPETTSNYAVSDERNSTTVR